ncbi:hypothetical protein AAFF_G00011800 [Aldrovandia affinis]|uniref:Uncharacterized protein n=1 Tax=Aldrovandia affinis TaxID=143900 RepID=A0AAD7S6D0_9TELE|nr:hypothetical protein AAFF_G00011800 [Aldrovandia affinis]
MSLFKDLRVTVNTVTLGPSCNWSAAMTGWTCATKRAAPNDRRGDSYTCRSVPPEARADSGRCRLRPSPACHCRLVSAHARRSRSSPQMPCPLITLHSPVCSSAHRTARVYYKGTCAWSLCAIFINNK